MPSSSQEETSHLKALHGNAGVIVKNGDYILCVKIKNFNKWDIPSGKPLSSNESSFDTASREAFEETGLKIEILSLSATVPEDKDSLFYIYWGKIKEEDPPTPITQPLPIPQTFSHEISEAKFVPINFLSSENFRFPSMLGQLKEVFYSLPGGL